jgi:hypothetical protein
MQELCRKARTLIVKYKRERVKPTNPNNNDTQDILIDVINACTVHSICLFDNITIHIVRFFLTQTLHHNSHTYRQDVPHQYHKLRKHIVWIISPYYLHVNYILNNIGSDDIDKPGYPWFWAHE